MLCVFVPVTIHVARAIAGLRAVKVSSDIWTDLIGTVYVLDVGKFGVDMKVSSL